MKGGLYITILFGALLCDAAVSVEIRPSQNVAGSGEFYDEKELNSEVDEINATREINVIKEASIENDRNSTSEYQEGSDINTDLKNSAEDFNDRYKKINASEFKEINKGENVSSKVKARGKLNRFSREEEPYEIFSGEEERRGIHDELHASPQGTTGAVDSLNSTMFSTVNHYACKIDEIAGNQLILYGTQSWTFPVQDVNLTLSYPTAESTSPNLDSAEEVDFIITGFKVILDINGVQTRGYITRGGVLHDEISLTFINSGISSLLYKFWLYGTPKHKINVTELHMMYYMCS